MLWRQVKEAYPRAEASVRERPPTGDKDWNDAGLRLDHHDVIVVEPGYGARPYDAREAVRRRRFRAGDRRPYGRSTPVTAALTPSAIYTLPVTERWLRRKRACLLNRWPTVEPSTA